MKKYVMFAITVACVALSSCVKDKEKDFADDQVSFSAQTGTIETRTAYGAVSEEIQVGGKYVQYVNWVTGDEITIVSSAGGSDDYTITLDHVGSDAEDISKANVSPKGGGIAWGTGVQTFYAMYPAANSTLGSSLSATDGMTCVIPATWTPARSTELGQLPYGYMFAKTGPISRTTNVSLTFNPKFSAFCFTLTNSSTTESITLSSLKLESGSKAMSGSYSVSTSGTPGNFPSYSDGSSNVAANNSVTVNFSSLPGDGNTITSGLTIPASGSATFSVVTLPQFFNDLTLYVTKSGGGTKKLQLKKGSSWIEFAALKKHNINVTLPEFGSFDYDFQVVNPTDLTYSGGTAHASVISTKTPSGGITPQDASWTVQGYYTDPECTVSATSYTSFLPSGIGAGGDGGQDDVSFSYAAASSTSVSSNYQTVAEADITGSKFGEGSSTTLYYNLSNPKDMTSNYIFESANSYIVNGTGYYKIPLVMGNGVKFNAPNTSAYNSANFVNYAGTPVTTSTPYLNMGSTPSAYVVWEDVDGLIDVVNTTDYVIKAGTGSTSTPIVQEDGVYWLRFHVNQAKQGNAVIAVTDGTNVMWSYHIWVTNYIPQNYPGYSGSDTNPGAGTHKISPVNLGWVYASTSTATGTRYAGNCIYAKLVQNGSNNVAVMKIDRPQISVVSPSSSGTSPSGSSPFYQWGRKDALLPALDGTDVTRYGKNKTKTTGAISSSGYVDSIKNPWKFFTVSARNTPWWGSGNKSDLWNLQTSNPDEAIKKTIYDPCPVGYCIPVMNLFSSYVGAATATNPALYLTYVAKGMKDKTSLVYHYDCGFRSHDYGSMAYYAGIKDSYGHYALASINGDYPYVFRFGEKDNHARADMYNNNTYPYAAGISVRPMQDPSFDPTDDGTTRGSGPSIDWVN